MVPLSSKDSEKIPSFFLISQIHPESAMVWDKMEGRRASRGLGRSKGEIQEEGEGGLVNERSVDLAKGKT
jgi:hypothetical protein